VRYPIAQLMDLARRIQVFLGEYHNQQLRSYDSGLSWDERNQISMQASNDLMSKAGTELLPDVQKILAQVEATIAAEQKAIADRVNPILSRAQQTAKHPTNPLGYGELSALLSNLA